MNKMANRKAKPAPEKGSRMERIFESKFMVGLNNFGIKLSNSKVFSSISKSMMSLLGIIMVGAVFQIVSTVPTLFKWFDTSSSIYNILQAPYTFTMGLMGLILALLVSYNYANALGMKPIQSGLMGMLVFLMVCSPLSANENGVLQAVSSISISYLGAQGLFVAIIIGIFSVKITHFCEKKNIVIKMPDSVPPFLAEAFSSIIPFLFNIIIFYGISTILSIVTKGQMSLPLLITYILSIPLNACFNSVVGVCIAILFACILWLFGIHGTMVIVVAAMAVMMQALTANAQAVAAGGKAQFYPCLLLFSGLACCGGTGNTLGLVFWGLRSKSEQLRAVSKAGLIPGLFGVNEPITFGFPIMYNPIMGIPFILTPLVSVFVLWIGYSIGFFKPSYILIMSLMPIGVGEFLGSLAWQNIFIPVVVLILSLVIYYPFFKAYEKQLVAKEEAAKAAEAVEAAPAN